MDTRPEEPETVKPLAGTCKHRWREQESPFLVSQVCECCKLYRYKPAAISDWEYRAPIPRKAPGAGWL